MVKPNPSKQATPMIKPAPSKQAIPHVDPSKLKAPAPSQQTISNVHATPNTKPIAVPGKIPAAAPHTVPKATPAKAPSPGIVDRIRNFFRGDQEKIIEPGIRNKEVEAYRTKDAKEVEYKDTIIQDDKNVPMPKKHTR
jgi:hypothetical protein